MPVAAPAPVSQRLWSKAVTLGLRALRRLPGA
jgi:hypothetical protein